MQERVKLLGFLTRKDRIDFIARQLLRFSENRFGGLDELEEQLHEKPEHTLSFLASVAIDWADQTSHAGSEDTPDVKDSLTTGQETNL